MRQASEVELAIQPRPEHLSRQEWLYREIRQAILSGRLKPGARLPASRDFARQQRVSRGTVLAAYDQLLAEGYLAANVGKGTYVSQKLPDSLQMRSDSRTPAGTGRPGRLSARGVRLASSPFPLHEAGQKRQPFQPNQPDFSQFPLTIWNRIAAKRANALRSAAMGYADAAGYLPLRQAIAEHLRYSQQIHCSAQQIAIVGSAQQALDICARLLLDDGDEVWMEEPGYPGARHMFDCAGARLVPVPVDGDGLQVDEGIRRSPDARMAYVTAAHQSPLGVSLALERRLALLSWAKTKRATLIEDDYDSEFRYHGMPLASLKSLDDDGRVIYLGTFSKLLFPSVRLAYVVLPDWLQESFCHALCTLCRHVPLATQRILSEFIADGHFARHLRRMRLIYQQRAQALAASCQSRLAGALHLLPITTGLDATAMLTTSVRDGAVAQQLALAGITARPLSFYRTQPASAGGLILGFSAFTPEEIDAGVATMATVLAGFD
ncbi:transcriptional regulator [Dickeya fangzhongdai]|uniref:MocR-like pyridoxine biosynthesis transcription factor PdxR n=1 Tax=Dickeya fangzhongdai TaxID=1778540 RepID=UPI000EB1E516|nr:PLP-dependent aminotransferase family protein [Dickeya fangzhongdai]AYH49435.1 transcriptional regulator [Dickeya fangzhongdai]UMB76139.1 PLP-dependent aminotransferase family protein [Dickeya fangzhongdai]